MRGRVAAGASVRGRAGIRGAPSHERAVRCGRVVCDTGARRGSQRAGHDDEDLLCARRVHAVRQVGQLAALPPRHARGYTHARSALHGVRRTVRNSRGGGGADVHRALGRVNLSWGVFCARLVASVSERHVAAARLDARQRLLIGIRQCEMV